jgi:drug/metabolite transporter (DMT)-like permease
MVLRASRGSGVLAVLASCLFFAAMAAVVKLLSADFDGMFLSLGRFVVGAIISASSIAFRRAGFEIRDPKDVVLRGLYGSAAMILLFISIQFSGAGRGTLFNSTSPLFSILIGAFMFREGLGRSSVVGAIFCFVGVAVIFWDSASPSLLGDAIGLLSGFLAGFSFQYTKRARNNNGTDIIYLSVCASGILVTFWTAPKALDLGLGSSLLLLAAAVLGYAGQISLTWGVKFMKASEAGILSFLKIPLTIVLGLFLGEGLSLRFAAGTAMVVGGLVISELGRARARPDPADAQREIGA